MHGIRQSDAALLALATLLSLAAAPAQSVMRLSTASGPGSRHPITALDADVVVWVAFVAGTRELMLSATDGSAPVQLTTGADVRVGHGTFDQWSPISVSDDGERIAYWNAQGVHVLDRIANTDTIVAPATLAPMPQLSGDGTRLVYQAPVSGPTGVANLEVFVVDADGATPPVQVTTGSGGGRRLPHVRGDRVVFQNRVGYEMELFVHDLATSTTGPALTNGSGGGNRHGRLTPDGDAVLYEAVVSGEQTVMRLDLAGTTPTVVGGNASGTRMPAGDGDDQIVLQTGVGTPLQPGVELVDPAATTLSGGSRGGHRLPRLDRHGQLVVWQEEDQGQVEVFALRRVWPTTATTFGTAGTPSVGTLQSFDRLWRLSQELGVHTQLPTNAPAFFVVGVQQQQVPVSGAPGNTQYVVPDSSIVVLIDSNGDAMVGIPLTANLLGFAFYAQFALFDPPANALGVVASAAWTVQVR